MLKTGRQDWHDFVGGEKVYQKLVKLTSVSLVEGGRGVDYLLDCDYGDGALGAALDDARNVLKLNPKLEPTERMMDILVDDIIARMMDMLVDDISALWRGEE